MGCSQPKDDRRAERRLQEWRRKGQMRHFLQYKGLVDGGGKLMDMDGLDRDLDKNNDDGQKIFRFFSIYSEFNATFATNEIITITSPTLAMSITS
ncbi:unknown [Prevotella sp. CAG:474]|nr:unknown [Prevotella sp. CAG:474]